MSRAQTNEKARTTGQEQKPAPVRHGVKVKETPPYSVINPRKITATTIIGDKIKDKDGKEVGKIEEIVFDLVSGELLYVVLAVGGFWGIGDKFLAIPLETLSLDSSNKEFSLNARKKDVKKFPGFDKHNWPLQAEWPPRTR